MTNGKKPVESTLERRLLILSRLPDGQDGITIDDVVDYLQQTSHACDKRTVQYDLAAMGNEASIWRLLGVRLLKQPSPLGRSLRWSHAAGSRHRLLRALGREDALMLSLLGQQLRYLMPASAQAQLAAYLPSAAQLLRQPANAAYARFLDRIRILPEGPERTMPEQAVAHMAEIGEALLQGEQIDMCYIASGQDQEKHYRLHPVGLVQQGLFHWLLAIKDHHQGDADLMSRIQSFRCDRMVGVARLPHQAVMRNVPSLDKALQAGRLAFFASEPIRLSLRFAPTPEARRLCDSYRDAPMGSGQYIVENGEGGYDLHTTVRRSLQLEWQLQREADRVTVLAPADLRAHMQQFAHAAWKLQGS